MTTEELKSQATLLTLTIPEAKVELRVGERYAGLVLNNNGLPSHHLILLPGEVKKASWQAAGEWAAQAGGELPTRREQSILFAHRQDEFEAAWYWSSEEYAANGSSAWLQDFGDGGQLYYRKSYEGRARAVRRLPA